MSADLIILAEKLNLWEITKNLALECIKNEGLNDLRNDHSYNEVTVEDFIFTKNQQCLIFWNNLYGHTYFIRTTYDLKVKNAFKKLTGYFSLDVDKEGKMLNEWLVFH